MLVLTLDGERSFLSTTSSSRSSSTSCHKLPRYHPTRYPSITSVQLTFARRCCSGRDKRGPIRVGWGCVVAPDDHFRSAREGCGRGWRTGHDFSTRGSPRRILGALRVRRTGRIQSEDKFPFKDADLEGVGTAHGLAEARHSSGLILPPPRRCSTGSPLSHL